MILSTTNADSDARMSADNPALVVSAHVTWPLLTPHAVKTPARLPPTSVLRIVSAVSCPGVTMTSTETPRNAASSCIAPVIPHVAGHLDLTREVLVCQRVACDRAQWNHACPDRQIEVVVEIARRTRSDLRRGFVDREREHGGAGELLLARRPRFPGATGDDMLDDRPERFEPLCAVVQFARAPENDSRAVVQRMVVDRAREHHRVQQCRRYADVDLAGELAQHPAR